MALYVCPPAPSLSFPSFDIVSLLLSVFNLCLPGQPSWQRNIHCLWPLWQSFLLSFCLCQTGRVLLPTRLWPCRSESLGSLQPQFVNHLQQWVWITGKSCPMYSTTETWQWIQTPQAWRPTTNPKQTKPYHALISSGCCREGRMDTLILETALNVCVPLHTPLGHIQPYSNCYDRHNVQHSTARWVITQTEETNNGVSLYSKYVKTNKSVVSIQWDCHLFLKCEMSCKDKEASTVGSTLEITIFERSIHVMFREWGTVFIANKSQCKCLF